MGKGLYCRENILSAGHLTFHNTGKAQADLRLQLKIVVHLVGPQHQASFKY